MDQSNERLACRSEWYACIYSQYFMQGYRHRICQSETALPASRAAISSSRLSLQASTRVCQEVYLYLMSCTSTDAHPRIQSLLLVTHRVAHDLPHDCVCSKVLSSRNSFTLILSPPNQVCSNEVHNNDGSRGRRYGSLFLPRVVVNRS